MSGLPQVTVTGTLVADVALRFTPSGAAVANLTIASNSRRLNKQTNEWEDGDATFLRANVWRQQAENAAEMTQGTRVIATGQLKQREFTTKDGDKRTVLELEIDEFGPSVRWATVKVNKVSRSGQQPPPPPASEPDPWGSSPGSEPNDPTDPPF